MFHRVTLHTSDPEASARFYDLVLGTLRIGRSGEGEGLTASRDLAIAPATDARRPDFYAAVGPRAGFAVRTDLPERVQLKGASGSFSVVAGDALTEHAQPTFAAAGEEAVPGREQDPDGNVVEIV